MAKTGRNGPAGSAALWIVLPAMAGGAGRGAGPGPWPGLANDTHCEFGTVLFCPSRASLYLQPPKHVRSQPCIANPQQ